MQKFLLLVSAIIASSILVSAVSVPRAVSTPSPQCVRRCQSCPATPQCAPGVSLVTDECGCCKVCARQIGEPCSAENTCDHHKSLYCSYSDNGKLEGRCVAKPGRSCYSGNKVYVTGESFNIGCKVTCTCIDGYLGCYPRCPTTITATAPKNCLHPRLVTKPNKCCEEWVCSEARLNNTTSAVSHPKPPRAQRRIPIFTNSHRPRVFASVNRRAPIAITVRAKDKCNVQTTHWSSCSKTCGWGVSERVVTDKSCKLRKQTRLCQLRPCRSDFASIIKNGKRCIRAVKSPRRVRYSFSGCRSKVYTPRYCGACTDGKCCTPKKTITKSIKFTCDNGTAFKKRMMVIKTCQCKRKCLSSVNDLFSSYRRMGEDTWRE